MNLPMIQNAVTLQNGVPTTTSLKVAEIFGKQHRNVIQSIERLEIPDEVSSLNFQPTSLSVPQPNGGTRQSPAYLITRDGFTLLAMGFTGKTAMQFKLAYIQAFNAMERKQKSGRGRASYAKLDELADRLERMTYRVQRLARLTDLAAFYAVPENAGEVADYCHSENLVNVDPVKFFEYYETRCWRSNGNIMDDWHAVARAWDRRASKSKELPGNGI